MSRICIQRVYYYTLGIYYRNRNLAVYIYDNIRAPEKAISSVYRINVYSNVWRDQIEEELTQ